MRENQIVEKSRLIPTYCICILTISIFLVSLPMTEVLETDSNFYSFSDKALSEARDKTYINTTLINDKTNSWQIHTSVIIIWKCQTKSILHGLSYLDRLK